MLGGTVIYYSIFNYQPKLSSDIQMTEIYPVWTNVICKFRSEVEGSNLRKNSKNETEEAGCHIPKVLFKIKHNS